MMQAQVKLSRRVDFVIMEIQSNTFSQRQALRTSACGVPGARAKAAQCVGERLSSWFGCTSVRKRDSFQTGNGEGQIVTCGPHTATIQLGCIIAVYYSTVTHVKVAFHYAKAADALEARSRGLHSAKVTESLWP